ncbi:MAG: hypothetical protein AB7G52_01685 [Arcobacter sp.]
MEYVKFKKPIHIKDILKEINIITEIYSDFINKNNMIYGVSNDLLDVDFTLSFVENIKNREQISKLSNALIITNSVEIEQFSDFNLVQVDDARYVFMKLLEKFKNDKKFECFTSDIEEVDQFISDKANIHPTAILEDNVIIKDNVVVSAGCIIKTGTFIDEGSIVRENSTIGCDGISLYKGKNEEVLRFPHIAGIYIGKNVEIGANCVIVRGTLTNTSIADHTVIGNLSNIGHGVKIGQKVWISVGAMIGGNCRIEDEVTIGLGVSIKNNLKIAKFSTVGMGSVVTKALTETKTVFGNPAKSVRPLNVGPKR